VNTNYYRVLGVHATATAKELKDAYRSKARHTHPDSPTGSDTDFRLLRLAYETLSNDEQREEYEEEYMAAARRSGKVVCIKCFQKNVVRQFTEGKRVCCGYCHEPMQLTPKERDSRIRAAVAAQTGELIEVIGNEGSALAKDAVRTLVDWSRRKLGIARSR